MLNKLMILNINMSKRFKINYKKQNKMKKV